MLASSQASTHSQPQPHERRPPRRAAARRRPLLPRRKVASLTGLQSAACRMVSQTLRDSFDMAPLATDSNAFARWSFRPGTPYIVDAVDTMVTDHVQESVNSREFAPLSVRARILWEHVTRIAWTRFRAW